MLAGQLTLNYRLQPGDQRDVTELRYRYSAWQRSGGGSSGMVEAKSFNYLVAEYRKSEKGKRHNYENNHA
jgi:hypothetical protein